MTCFGRQVYQPMICEHVPHTIIEPPPACMVPCWQMGFIASWGLHFTWTLWSIPNCWKCDHWTLPVVHGPISNITSPGKMSCLVSWCFETSWWVFYSFITWKLKIANLTCWIWSVCPAWNVDVNSSNPTWSLGSHGWPLPLPIVDSNAFYLVFPCRLRYVKWLHHFRNRISYTICLVCIIMCCLNSNNASHFAISCSASFYTNSLDFRV